MKNLIAAFVKQLVTIIGGNGEFVLSLLDERKDQRESSALQTRQQRLTGSEALGSNMSGAMLDIFFHRATSFLYFGMPKES